VMQHCRPTDRALGCAAQVPTVAEAPRG
jgi:hypothetical protein